MVSGAKTVVQKAFTYGRKALKNLAAYSVTIILANIMNQPLDDNSPAIDYLIKET